jgi:hypothetical protein
MDATAAAKAVSGSASNPIEIVDVEPVEIVDVEPVEIIDVEPIQILDVEPVDIMGVEPIHSLEVEQAVVQSPPLPILPAVVTALETNDEEPAATVESTSVVVEMQEEGSTFLEDVDVDDVNDNEYDDVSESSDVPTPMEVSALQDEEIIFTLETVDEEITATVNFAPFANALYENDIKPIFVEMEDKGFTLSEEVDVDDVNNDDGCDDLAQSSALNPIDLCGGEQVLVQSPPLPTQPTALETNVEDTAATVESVPVVGEMQDEGSTLLEAVDVDVVNDDGCDDFIQSTALNQIEIADVEQVVVQSPPLPILPLVINAHETSVDEIAIAVEPAPVVVYTEDECSTCLEEVDVDDMNDDGCEDLSESSGVPKAVEPLALRDEEIEDSSPLAMAIESPNEKTPEEAVINEDIIPSHMNKVEGGEEYITIHDALPQPAIKSIASLEETTEKTIQEIPQETAEETKTKGKTEGDPENNHEEPVSTNTSSLLSRPIKSGESSGEDIDTTFEVTDNEEEIEDLMEETPENSDVDAFTCKSENDNIAISSFARLSGDQTKGCASHTSNESPESGCSISSSVQVHSQIGADEEVPMDPNLIEEGRAGGVVNETKELIPKETFWAKHKVKLAFGCFLLVVLVAVVFGVVVAGSGGGVSPTISPTAAAPSLSPSAVSPVFNLEKFQAVLPAYSQAALLDESSSQAKAFAWLERDSDLASYSDFQRLQRFALATLFYATNGEEWSNNNGWVEKFRSDECDWFLGEPRSIEECVNGRYEELTLDLNGLGGTLPDELAMMTDLKILRLSFNGLKGAIPSEYGLLTNLNTLSLYLNILDGRIPSELGRLTALEDIDLTRNSLTGPIPSEMLTGWNEVKMLRISGNNFSGVIPSEVGNLKNVEVIDFSDNAFEGQIPSELALLTNLETLYLHNNADISGQIPSVLGSLSQLQIITFDNTNLSGAMPRELCDLIQRHFVVIEVDCSRITCDCGCSCV